MKAKSTQQMHGLVELPCQDLNPILPVWETLLTIPLYSRVSVCGCRKKNTPSKRKMPFGSAIRILETSRIELTFKLEEPQFLPHGLCFLLVFFCGFTSVISISLIPCLVLRNAWYNRPSWDSQWCSKPGSEPATSWSSVPQPNHYTTGNTHQSLET